MLRSCLKSILFFFLVVTFLVVTTHQNAQADDFSDNPTKKEITLDLRVGEPLSSQEKEAVNIMLSFYKSRSMDYELDMLKRTLSGDLSPKELGQIKANGGVALAASYISYDSQNTGCIWAAWIERPWWLNGRNEHAAYSTRPEGGDCPIERMDMRVRGWHNGAEVYDEEWGFDNASSLWSRNHGASPGNAQSDARFKAGWEDVTLIPTRQY